MNLQDKFIRRFQKAVQSRQMDKCHGVRDWGAKVLGCEKMAELMTVALENVPAQDFDWFIQSVYKQAPPEIQKQIGDKAMDIMARQMVEEGLVPGADFSRDPELGLVLGDKAKETLISQVREDRQADVQELFHTSIRQQPSIKDIEKVIGIENFFETFALKLRQHCQPYLSLGDLGYCSMIAGNFCLGVEKRYPELAQTTFAPWFLVKVFGEGVVKRLFPVTYEGDPAKVVIPLWNLLNEHLGAKPFPVVQLENGEKDYAISVEDIRRIARVYENPNENAPSLALLAAKLEAVNRK